MAEMMQLSPMNMSLIFVVVCSVLIGCLWGWRHSIYTRRLARFAMSLLFALALFLILFTRLFPPVSSYVVIAP